MTTSGARHTTTVITTTARVLDAIANDKSMELFKLIAARNGIGSKSLKDQARLTRKQYYSRLATLVGAGLVVKRSGEYMLTSLGRVTYNMQATVDVALANFWKLRAIDSLDASGEIAAEEEKRLIDALLPDNQQLRSILAK